MAETIETIVGGLGIGLTSSSKDGHDGEQDSQESSQKFHPV
jgi:hypothetical protein